ncbi:E3 UFM1-protein ligase 1 [Hypsibius exemplaris]|uniref:E3 UFM1-protein ligase 1 homolog n=1 Tax=Hypsibius exemplaris TaxID=2072580 RepID=A0A1W0WZX2_HYPEX|nr:E3 UFM1-protein ligase 1 [Hypsibius exemplaris]
MAGQDWEDVRRLMSDFQRVQQGNTAQRLSERNCIEIVSNLVKLKLLDVVYTTDGKEYITPQQLVREIREEMFVNGGRVNVVDIAQALNVDLSHVETAAKDLMKTDSSLQFVLGQLISADYVTSLADEINEKLQEKGVVDISDMTVVFDLPADFILGVVGSNLGTRIHGQRDLSNPRVLLTDWLIARHRAILRGALNASSRPVSVQSLVKEHSLNERLTSVVVEELISLGEISGILSGKGSKDKSTFIPHIYTTAQTAWIEAFLKSNSYIPYNAVKKLDIGDPKQFLKNRYSVGDEYLFLETCILSKTALDRVEGGLEDVAASGTWTEIGGLFPAGVDDQDVAEVIETLLTTKKIKDIRLVQDIFVVAEKMVEESKKLFDTCIETIAEEDAKKQSSMMPSVPSGASKKAQADDDEDLLPSSKKDRKGKRQTGKGATKSAGKGKRDEEDDSGASVPEFLTVPALVVELQKANEDAPFELLEAIARAIQADLVESHRRVLKVKVELIAASSAGDRKSTHKAVQEQISATIWLMRMFAKGIEHFSAETDKKQLAKLLLRNVGAEVLNPLLFFLMEDLGLALPERTDLTPEARTKLVAKLPEPPRAAFEKTNTGAAGDNIDTFEDSLQSLLDSESIGMPIRKADKKKETQICQEHRQQLLQGIRSATDIPTALRLCCLSLFLKKTAVPLEAPGKFVPQILAIVKPDLKPEQAAVLEQARDMMQDGGQSPDDIRAVILKLADLA